VQQWRDVEGSFVGVVMRSKDHHLTHTGMHWNNRGDIICNASHNTLETITDRITRGLPKKLVMTTLLNDTITDSRPLIVHAELSEERG
jgi:hypothetical protein